LGVCLLRIIIKQVVLFPVQRSSFATASDDRWQNQVSELADIRKFKKATNNLATKPTCPAFSAGQRQCRKQQNHLFSFPYPTLIIRNSFR